jgi:1-phosphofructokinase
VNVHHHDEAVAVFAPNIYLTVTIEGTTDGCDEVHCHAGGQGVWVARIIRNLGEQVTLHTVIGGETGTVVEGLVRHSGIALRAVRVRTDTPAYVHDRRGGDRRELAQTPARPLSRHELDDLYESTLAGALAAGLLVLTGRPDIRSVPARFYHRLGADLAAAGVRVVGDLHGEELTAFLDGGPLELLKVSHEDLAEDGLLGNLDDDEEVLAVLAEFGDRGVRNMVVSRADRPFLARFGPEVYSCAVPRLATADHRGSGDSMTGALAVALARGLSPRGALALAAGAGAANVTRHGLATADALLITELAGLAEVDRRPPDPADDAVGGPEPRPLPPVG